MTKIAVIKTGGKQYKVKEGQTIKVEKIDNKEGAKVKIDTLLISDSQATTLELGKPSLGEKVEAKIVEQGKNKKVKVIKYKSKTRYKRNIGHRQNYTKLEITKIA